MTRILDPATFWRHRLLVATLTGIWALALVLAWLLLPLLLRPEGTLLVLWYAAGWVATVALFLLPYGVGSVYGGRE